MSVPIERQRFFAEPHVAALSVAVPGRGPVTMPIWYGYEPGGDVWIITSPTSAKMRAIRDAGRLSLLVDVTAPMLRYVAVEGPVISVAPATATQVAALAERYLHGLALESYLEQARRDHGDQVIVTIRPDRWTGAQIPMPSDAQ